MKNNVSLNKKCKHFLIIFFLANRFFIYFFKLIILLSIFFFLLIQNNNNIIFTFTSSFSLDNINFNPFFNPDNINFNSSFNTVSIDLISPMTGMNKKKWVDIGINLLIGAFNYIKSYDDVFKFPEQINESYANNLKDQLNLKESYLESLSRTMLIAAPLLKINETLTINNIMLKTYYLKQLTNIVKENSEIYIDHFNYTFTRQATVELANICFILTYARDILWDPLPEKIKNKFALLLLSYANGETNNSNWYLFNIIMLSFLKHNNYETNDKKLYIYLNRIINFYSGSDGCYFDNGNFDYYSSWVFLTFTSIWCKYYSYMYPNIGEKLLKNFKELLPNYLNFFDRNGRMNMFGRSLIYRYASVSPLSMYGFIFNNNSKVVNYGWIRYISSSTLLQFINNKNYMDNGVPNMGIYGISKKFVDNYSCRGSVYYSGITFMNLLLPDNHPYWTSIENRGIWEDKKFNTDNDKTVIIYLKGIKSLITNYISSGITELRFGTLNYFKSPHYNKLSYNTEFIFLYDDFENGIISMNYLFKFSDNKWILKGNKSFLDLQVDKHNKTNYIRQYQDDDVCILYKDIILENGFLRIDKITSRKNATIRFGSYGIPIYDYKHKKELIDRFYELEELKVEYHEILNIILENSEKFIISGKQKSMALIPLKGWNKITKATSINNGAESEFTDLILAETEIKENEEKFIYSLILWKKDQVKNNTNNFDNVGNSHFIKEDFEILKFILKSYVM